MNYIKLFTQNTQELADMDDILRQLYDEATEIEEAEAAVNRGKTAR